MTTLPAPIQQQHYEAIVAFERAIIPPGVVLPLRVYPPTGGIEVADVIAPPPSPRSRDDDAKGRYPRALLSLSPPTCPPGWGCIDRSPLGDDANDVNDASHCHGIPLSRLHSSVAGVINKIYNYARPVLLQGSRSYRRCYREQTCARCRFSNCDLQINDGSTQQGGRGGSYGEDGLS